MRPAQASLAGALAAAALLALPVHAAEIAAGPSWLQSSGDAVPGGAVSATWRQDRRLAVVLEVSAHVGETQGEDLRAIALYAGAQYRMWMQKRLHPFLALKLGALSSRRQVEVFGTAVGPDGVCDGGCPSDFGLSAEGGGGLELRLTRRFALRAPEAEYRVSRIAGEWETGLRLSGSLVVRW